MAAVRASRVLDRDAQARRVLLGAPLPRAADDGREGDARDQHPADGPRRLEAWADGALARAQANLRSKRDALLAATDFYALSDVIMSDDMKTYRQELRDLPSGKDTVAKCNDATFPTKP